MMKKHLLLLLALGFTFYGYSNTQTKKDTIITNEFRGGFGVYPLINKTRIGYRGNINNKWSFDSKFGYTFTLAPQFNIELNTIRRFNRNEILNFYSGIGFTIDGFTPGINFPIGFELAPIEKFPNLVFVLEASPKVTFSFSSAFSSTLNGNVGLIYFRPQKTKRK